MTASGVVSASATPAEINNVRLWDRRKPVPQSFLRDFLPSWITSAGANMIAMRLLLRLGIVSVCLGSLAACGSDQGASDTTPTAASSLPESTLPSSTVTELTITVGTDNEPSIKTATLRVIDGGGASGTGFLADAQRAERAAAVFEDPAAVKRLVDGPPADQMCTMIYGGPDRATIEGTFRGAAVTQQFHRSDGCGIADWELFEPILGRSHWDGEHRIYQGDENQVAVKAGETFTIELESNATTGYAWSAVVAPTGSLVEGEHQYLQPSTTAVGAGGWEWFRYTASAAGTATITFEYRRPWEPATTPPAATATFTVTITA